MATSIEALLARTRRAQGEAADPAASVWVSANAGTGKTHVLTMRVLRLMLAATPPERILCLTYTKAAAAEMSKRVFARLAEWVTMPDADLDAALNELVGRAPTREETVRARTLFTAAIETPGGLKVQTIHAFCERLLQRFPLEAGVTPGFTIVEDDLARSLRREAIDAVLRAAIRDASSALGAALRKAIVHAADDRLDEIVIDALKERAWLEVPETEETRRRYCRLLGVPDDAKAEMIEREMSAVLNEASLIALRNILTAGSANDAKIAQQLGEAAAAASPALRIGALRTAFLNKEGDPRTRLITKGTGAANPGAEATLQQAQQRFVALEQQRVALSLVEATMALLTIARAASQAYRAGKARRAALDYDDLIERTQALLHTGASADWVLYKLDSGLDHILVDESQDTSPAQWRIVKALADEFFSGSGAHPSVRTLFAVGDEKQSIYSFQGAAPEMFAEKGREFQAMAESAGIAWRGITLDMSFRSLEPILSAVDGIFTGDDPTPGVAHVVKRLGHAGLVELWPPEKYEQALPADVWSAGDEQVGAAPPAVRLANRIADTIEGWLDRKEALASEGRPITAGDILILVRKRHPFAAPMIAALMARRIAVAGADRLRLTEQIAVEDLVSLGDFLTLPEDDLALAEVLKSPIFNLDDDDLLRIAHGRKGTLWNALLGNTDLKPAYAEAAATLKRWRKGADFAPPFEFFASLLDRDGVRAKLLSRLGPDAADPIDELLNLALTYDDHAPPSLSGFLHWLREGEREIKRDMDHGRDEVRVMTVHGAKGLEAPIVFLPDTCSAASAGRRGGGTMPLAGASPFPEVEGPLVWAIKGCGTLEAIRAAKAAIDASEREERSRLLYVAMTRARDRLYIAGFEGQNGPEPGCWYELIEKRLRGALDEVVEDDGRRTFRRASQQDARPEPPSRAPGAGQGAAPLPGWAKRPAPREPQLSVPLAPSRLAPYEIDDAGEPSLPAAPKEALAEPPALSPLALAEESRFLRGSLTHGLLEHLPAFEPAAWARTAKAFVARRGAALPARTQRGIVAEALAILNDTTFAPLFGPGSRAEVPVAAVIPRPKGTGPALRITGQIDRLAEIGNEVLIVDYKTNRPPPREAAGVADAYLYQLAAYRLAVGQIFKGKSVRAAILWTDGPRLLEIPARLLDDYASRLWDLDPARLDA